MENPHTAEEMTEIKKQIESLDKYHQVEILKILVENGAKTNENKSGIFVNITLLDGAILQKIMKYLEYVRAQNLSLDTLENEKNKYKEIFSGAAAQN
jgi:hypothetical protein